MNHRGTETQRTELPAGMNHISGAIVDAAYAVHLELGPGLLESIYEKCLFNVTKIKYGIHRVIL